MYFFGFSRYSNSVSFTRSGWIQPCSSHTFQLCDTVHTFERKISTQQDDPGEQQEYKNILENNYCYFLYNRQCFHFQYDLLFDYMIISFIIANVTTSKAADAIFNNIHFRI